MLFEQECPTFELYLTLSDRERLTNPDASDRACIAVIKNRAKMIGLHWASEPTKGRIAQILNHLAHGGNLQGIPWYEFLQKVKTALKSLQTTCDWPFEFIQNYPADPNSLCKEVFEHAFGNEAPGMIDIKDMDLPDFLRTSSKKKLKGPAHV